MNKGSEQNKGVRDKIIINEIYESARKPEGDQHQASARTRQRSRTRETVSVWLPAPSRRLRLGPADTDGVDSPSQRCRS